MGLKNCPDCNLMLFDTDTECIYCGWKQQEKTIETPAEVTEAEITEVDESTTLEDNTAHEQAIEKNIEHKETVVDAKKQAVAELKDIKKGFDAVLNVAKKKIEEPQIDIEDTIEDDTSSFTEEDYNNGIRYLDGKRFNLFDIIKKYGVANKVQIIKEIRDVTDTSLKNAVKVLDNAFDDFLEYQRKNYIEQESSDYEIQINPKADNIQPLINNVQGNIHRALAYNMIIKKGPDRKTQIIDELMRSEHITLPHATKIVDDAIREYRENTKSQ